MGASTDSPPRVRRRLRLRRRGASPDFSEEPASEPLRPEPEPEPELPRFAAPFSSPEPTAVVARPRRRATRSVIAADPDSVEAPAPAPAVPAFISFVAPSETEAPPPRRRGRRPAEAPEAEAVEEPAAAEDTEEAAAPPRRSRSRRRPRSRSAGTSARRRDA